MNIKKTFQNLNSSPMAFSDPAWQTEIIKRINEEYHDRAVECNAKFREEVEKVVSNPDAIYSGPAVLRIVREIPKLCYIKNYVAPDGKTYNIEIDLLAFTVIFIEI